MVTRDARSAQFDNSEVRNGTTRSGFDLSETLQFTSKIGQLDPIYHRTVFPLDKFRIKTSMITQSLSFKSIPYTNIRQHIDWFFVPYDQLYKNSSNVLTSNTENTNTAISPIADLNTLEYMPRISSDFLFTNSDYSIYKVFRDLIDHSTNVGDTSFIEDEVGMSRFHGCQHLLNFLGYGYLTDSELEALILNKPSTKYSLHRPQNFPAYVSALPLLAYHKIYNDIYRRSRWENTIAYNFNCDYTSDGIIGVPTFDGSQSYWSKPTLFDIHYCSYPKDLLFGLIPDAQYGAPTKIDVQSSGLTGALTGVSTVPSVNVRFVDGSGSQVYAVGSLPYNKSGSATSRYVGGVSSNPDGYSSEPSFKNNGVPLVTSPVRLDVTGSVQLQNLQSNFNYLSVRNAQFLQKYKEILGSGELDYDTIMHKIFGIKLSPDKSHKVQYLGGSVSYIKFDQVVNTNLEGVNSEAVRVSNGFSSDEGEYIEFDCKDHGIIMCIYHAEPMLSFASDGLHFDVVKTSVDDFANPVFDKLGYEELDSAYFYQVPYSSSALKSGSLGYTKRYFDYKTGFDRVMGDFRESRSNFVTPVNTEFFSYYFSSASSSRQFILDSSFFKVRPSQLDPITYVQADANYNTDQFSNSVSFDIKSVRNLDFDGLPY